MSILIRFHDISKLEDLSICLLSLKAQTYEAVEPIILTQRFSPDQIRAVEEVLGDYEWSSVVNARVVNVNLKEPADLRTHLLNVGIKNTVDARFLAVLDYDDFAGQEHCNRLIARLKDTDAAIAYSGMIVIEQVISKFYKYTVSRKFVVRNDFRIQKLHDGPHYQMACFMVDRLKVKAEDLKFDENIVYEEDYNIHLRLSLKYPSDFSVAGEKVPALMRAIRRDGSNSVISTYDTKEEVDRKRALWRNGKRVNSRVRHDNYKPEFDPFVMLWTEPLPIRGGTAYNWVVYSMGLGMSQLPKRFDYGHLRVAHSARYSPLISTFGQKNWAFRMDYESVRMLEHLLGPNLDWNKDSVAIWKDLMRGKGVAFEQQLILLDKSYDVFPFRTVLTFGVNGAVAAYAKENNISHVSLELGPTRQPFVETGHCDPFGVNGDSVLSKLPSNFLLPKLESEDWLDTFVARSGINVPKIPEIVEQMMERGAKRVALIPLQLADDANFLLHAEQYTSFRDFLVEVIPALVASGWACLIRPHPFANKSAYTEADNNLCREWCDAQESEWIVWYDNELTQTEKLGLLAGVDAVVTVNSSVGFEAMLMGTTTVTMGRASFVLPAHMPTLEDLQSGGDLERFRDLQRRLVAFNLFHHQVPIGDIFFPATLMRRLDEAAKMRAVYEETGAEGLAAHLVENVRSSLVDYFTMGRNPMSASPPAILHNAPLLNAVPTL
ncbi:hypothetical protein [Rhizobium sp. BK602]|uniref:capsular polysaccharide export protein, LipB/KpsS family n=1 Tax=Rhizobium sp. BK602 TaxID=2586986 RepID=UPI001621F170|nr:glycosyltransferase involved in cell wall biosynthesis [Rhizobium sp. BK602]